jgi:uncharacterized protein (DUF486 family)
MVSASFNQLTALINFYKKLLPISTFPYIPLVIAAGFQSLAWMAGPIFLQNLTLIPRVLFLLMFAVGEYSFMSPTMNAAVEVLKMAEPFLVVIYQVITLIVFIFINIFVFKKPFEKKYVISSILLAAAVFVAYMF